MIDDVKTKLTDQEYKQLCDKMMEMNKKEKDYYRVWYITVDVIIEDFEEDEDENGKNACETQYYQKFNNVVIKLSPQSVADMRSTIQRNGHCCADHKLLNVYPRTSLPVVTRDKGYVAHFPPTSRDHLTVIRIDDLE